MKTKIVKRELLVEIVKQLKSEGKKVISTSGCFDILHAGHVQYLREAKAKGDILVILLNSDKSVRTLKGPSRPIVCEEDRAYVLESLEMVDYICIFDEQTPCDLISRIQPDAVIKGGDYREKHIPEMDVVDTYGGTVEYVSLVEGHSTTNIIEKIKKQLKEEMK
jgi:rfaE bifunctional protein nucleotidyltransferase chain/domain